MTDYVHGYSEREAQRLHDQAGAVQELLHGDTIYPAGSRVLEAGCGVGAQTITLARNSPEAVFTCVDLAAESVDQARELAGREGLANVGFLQGDIFALPFDLGYFDHVFVCFLLEHLADPEGALRALGRVIKPGGSLTVIEGDHGSCYFNPETEAARAAWQCLIEVQAGLGGDSLIGRRLYPLLDKAGYGQVTVSPRMVYCDRSRPRLVEAFVRKTIIPMVEGVKAAAFDQGLIRPEFWERGLADLHRTADDPAGTFCYTFFKAMAQKPR
jgi:SAM-dependent methyltransferase